jgi:ABC-2 type transport system ATP-binding protein
MSDSVTPVPTPPVVVDLRNLTKTFGYHAAVVDVSLQVRRGEILALLGPNGAGKTTTMRMLMGILAPTRGEAKVLGHDCFRQRELAMRHIGYLPDEPTFQDHLRGAEVLRFCGAMRGMRDGEVVARIEELAKRLDLADALEEYAVNYSLGMRKKLALAAAMLHRPAALVLDEPTNGLDPVVTRALLELVREAAAAGTAVLYSTHLLAQAGQLCHRVAIVHRGRLAALGTPGELQSQLAPGGTLEDVFFQVAAPSDADAKAGAAWKDVGGAP